MIQVFNLIIQVFNDEGLKAGQKLSIFSKKNKISNAGGKLLVLLHLYLSKIASTVTLQIGDYFTGHWCWPENELNGSKL